MPDNVRVLECPQCKRLHEVDPAKSGGRFLCECGNELKVESLRREDQGGQVQPAPQAGRPLRTRLPALSKNWKVISVAAAVIIGLGALFTFLHEPERRLPQVAFAGQGGELSRLTPKEDPEIFLKILEDNSQISGHANASLRLLSMRDSRIVPRLCELLDRKELASRPIVLRMLGELGDDRALSTLEGLARSDDPTVAGMSIASITQVGSPVAESVLYRLLSQPAKTREIIPHIARVRNDVAARVVGACLDQPSLRMLVLNEIARSRLLKCAARVAIVAEDRDIPEPDRLKSIETLGELNCPESRRALATLLDDSTVSGQARLILNKQLGRSQ
jgi:hypothetical protein